MGFDGFTIVDKAQHVEHRNGAFSYGRMCYQDGNTLIFARQFAITAPSIEADAYPEAREFLAMVRKYDDETVVLKRGP